MCKKLTLAEVAAHPELAAYALDSAVASGSVGDCVLRPLLPGDVDGLAEFLAVLSPATRRFSTFVSYDRAMAAELCDSINRYDKLRFVVELPATKLLVGLIEFSFDLPMGDLQRYAAYGVPLDASGDCRFGPTFADVYQNQGLGSRVFPHVVDIARRFGKIRIILWGGVLADNGRALRFYAKQGFQPVGTFVAADGEASVDMMLDLETRC